MGKFVNLFFPPFYTEDVDTKLEPLACDVTSSWVK